MSNVFSPGELIGLLRAERMGRALEEAICYQAVLLGITRASMNTQIRSEFSRNRSSFSRSSSPRAYRLVERPKRKRCSGGMIHVGSGFKTPSSEPNIPNNIAFELKKKKSIRGGNERYFVLP
ncbi:putative DNA-directed RNA polymerase [Helianthus debilis subsp. tardiflorus]